MSLGQRIKSATQSKTVLHFVNSFFKSDIYKDNYKLQEMKNNGY